MRLRLAFKLHGEEADLARQLSDISGVPVDSIAKLAMQKYMQDVIARAQEEMKKQQSMGGVPDVSQHEVQSTGTVSSPSDPVLGQAEGQ